MPNEITTQDVSAIPLNYKPTRAERRAANAKANAERAQAELITITAREQGKREVMETKRMLEGFQQAKFGTRREKALMQRERNFTRETTRQARVETRLRYAEARKTGLYVGFWDTTGQILAGAFRLPGRVVDALRPTVPAQPRSPDPTPRAPTGPQRPEYGNNGPSNPLMPDAPDLPQPAGRAAPYQGTIHTPEATGFEKTPSGLYVPNSKFTLTEQVKFEMGRQLHRIQAVNNFGFVKAGTLGGWVESARNLSEHGASWIGEDASAFASSLVDSDAQLYGRAQMRDHARATDTAHVFGDAELSGNVRIGGHARVGGNTRLGGSEYIGGDEQVLRTPRPRVVDLQPRAG